LHRRIVNRGVWALTGLLFVWILASYLIMPMMWRRYTARHPFLNDAPRTTHTRDGIPGDPLNLTIIATEEELHNAMRICGWTTADKITVRSSIKIGAASIFRRPYKTAPVSNLFLFGRKQDLAFQQSAGNDPRKRHHVRFWKTENTDNKNRPIWYGAATYDERVGLSGTTGQFTHHIACNIDNERDKILRDLEKSRLVDVIDWEDGFHEKLEGRNGGGDLYRTDGRMPVAILLLGALPAE
jgi:hypothetical protein